MAPSILWHTHERHAELDLLFRWFKHPSRPQCLGCPSCPHTCIPASATTPCRSLHDDSNGNFSPLASCSLADLDGYKSPSTDDLPRLDMKLSWSHPLDVEYMHNTLSGEVRDEAT
ncbi:hypothetical protein H310_06975 [Aphanomyces invadans]|uniref:Uncharacterized protein n=1 Tax=Aphanomyces invadans TaxID=157072 RepID=A0A024U4Z2_9STRA|nr:hypothetical protein H310_06975 [Aphanomyces invadans]ETW01461.1 hypothetical protein H310_06975 [Aphanomyces invadans]|eukprot:XP_008870459.1 hypothetical protein H310_06975 [Aphanomyces invadans]